MENSRESVVVQFCEIEVGLIFYCIGPDGGSSADVLPGEEAAGARRQRQGPPRAAGGADAGAVPGLSRSVFVSLSRASC